MLLVCEVLGFRYRAWLPFFPRYMCTLHHMIPLFYMALAAGWRINRRENPTRDCISMSKLLHRLSTSTCTPITLTYLTMKRLSWRERRAGSGRERREDERPHGVRDAAMCPGIQVTGHPDGLQPRRPFSQVPCRCSRWNSRRGSPAASSRVFFFFFFFN
jgi:hypothetical protein